MATVGLSPVAVQDFQIGGVPAVGAQLFVYAAGSTTKITTYTDSTGGTATTNPIIMNSRGEPEGAMGQSLGIWVPTTTAYKLVFASATDTDPPTSPIWSVDGLNSSGSGGGGGSSTVTPISSNQTLVAGSSNGVLTSGGAYTLTLPAISSLSTFNSFIVFDGQNNAAVNPITITATGSDGISYYGSTGNTSIILDVDSAAVLIAVMGSVWRVIAL